MEKLLIINSDTLERLISLVDTNSPYDVIRRSTLNDIKNLGTQVVIEDSIYDYAEGRYPYQDVNEDEWKQQALNWNSLQQNNRMLFIEGAKYQQIASIKNDVIK